MTKEQVKKLVILFASEKPEYVITRWDQDIEAYQELTGIEENPDNKDIIIFTFGNYYQEAHTEIETNSIFVFPKQIDWM